MGISWQNHDFCIFPNCDEASLVESETTFFQDEMKIGRTKEGLDV